MRQECGRETEGKPLQTVVRPALLYGTETWATTRGSRSTTIEVNDMRMLRWMCGVTRRDKVRKGHIRGTTRVVKKKREAKLKGGRCV